MSMFRAKKLDLGCFVNIKVIRDHTKRKVYEKHEAERYVRPPGSHQSKPRPLLACLPAGILAFEENERRRMWESKG